MVGIIKNDIRSLLREIKKADLVWRYASNLSSTMSFRRGHRTTLRGHEKEILLQLNTSGVAITSVEELFGDERILHELTSAVQPFLDAREDDLPHLRADANDDHVTGRKTFNLEIFGGELKFDVKDRFARFALNESLLRIADAYFGMYVKLRYYNVWKTFASKGPSRESQLWHFDREDNYILKVFLYLDDVDEWTGPFTYAPGTHGKGKYRNIRPEFFMEGGVRRTTDDQMIAVYPEEKWVRAVGRKGTVIFADTRGFHKGGEARTKDRLMFTCMFTSPASESKRLIIFPDNLDLSTLTPKQRQALHHK